MYMYMYIYAYKIDELGWEGRGQLRPRALDKILHHDQYLLAY